MTDRRAITGILLEPVGEVLRANHGKRTTHLKHRAKTVGTAHLLTKSKTRCRVGAVHHPQQSGIAHPPHRDPSVPVGEQHRGCRSVQPVGEPIEHWPSRDMQRVLAVNLGAERQRWDVRLGSKQRRPAPGSENFRPHRRRVLVATQERGTSEQYVACLMHEFTCHLRPLSARQATGRLAVIANLRTQMFVLRTYVLAAEDLGVGPNVKSGEVEKGEQVASSRRPCRQQKVTCVRISAGLAGRHPGSGLLRESSPRGALREDPTARRRCCRTGPVPRRPRPR